MDLNPPVSLAALSKIIHSKVKGNENYRATGINEIHLVRTGDITFVDHPKYYERALNSAATVIIINRDQEPPAGKNLLISDDPFRDYNILTRYFAPFEPSMRMISESAEIGDDTIIQPGVFIGHHVKIGNRCLIHSHVSIGDRCVIGDDCIIHPNTVIGGDAFYFQKRKGNYERMHSCGRVVVGNRVEIGCSCTIDRGVSGDTTIGEGSKLDNQVHIGHDTVIGKNCLFAAQVGIAGVTRIEDDVILWGQVGVNKDLVIGKNAIVYAQSGVASSIEGNKTYFGSPVQEARTAFKQIALIKRLKELFNRHS